MNFNSRISLIDQQTANCSFTHTGDRQEGVSMQGIPDSMLPTGPLYRPHCSLRRLNLLRIPQNDITERTEALRTKPHIKTTTQKTHATLQGATEEDHGNIQRRST